MKYMTGFSGCLITGFGLKIIVTDKREMSYAQLKKEVKEALCSDIPIKDISEKFNISLANINDMLL